MEWYLQAMHNFADFSGRARRTEYWTFSLIAGLFIGLPEGFGIIMTLSPDTRSLGVFLYWAGILISLVHFIPSFSCLIRRLHDTGKSGFWTLILLAPSLGLFIDPRTFLLFICLTYLFLLVLCLQDSEPGYNQYGPNPKDPDDSAYESEYASHSTSLLGLKNITDSPTSAKAAEKDIYQDLTRLDDLRTRGILSDYEFGLQKAKLLGTPLQRCRKCGTPVNEGTRFCSECGTPYGCRNCGQPIMDGIRFCSECGASVVANEPQLTIQAPEPLVQSPEPVPQEPVSSAPTDSTPSLVANEGTAQPTADILETPSNSIDVRISAVEDKKPINKRLLVILILLIITMAFVTMHSVRETWKTNSESNTSVTAPASNASAASLAVATPPATQLTQQPPNPQPDNDDCTPTQPDASSVSSTSLLDVIDGKKLKVGSLSCDLNGGTYSLFSRNCGHVIVLGGAKQAASTKHSFAYDVEQSNGFSYSDRFYAKASDTAATYLGADVMTGMDEIRVEKQEDGSITITSQQSALNMNNMVKGIKSYDINSDTQTTQFCEP